MRKRIRGGSIQVASGPTPAASNDFLAALIRTAYLPTELPPVITSKFFSDFCRSEYAWITSAQPDLNKRFGEVESYTAPRNNAGRRILALVNPICQLRLSYVITENRADITQLLLRSPLSLYKATEDLPNNKAYSGLEFARRFALQAQLTSEFTHVMRADISRFFYTAYTHSIPWAVLGKEEVKEALFKSTGAAKKRFLSHWSNQLDGALQACRSRETFGLPVGPDTSRIIAEILLSGVELNPAFAKWIKGRPAFRLVDDFFIGFDNEADALAALQALRSALWQYNLQLNDEKSGVVASSSLKRERWRLEAINFPLSATNEQSQHHDIHRLVDFTYHWCSEARSATPASYACNSLSNLKIIRGNFAAVLDCLLRLGRDFPSCLHLVCAFLINKQENLVPAGCYQRACSWVRSLLAKNFAQQHDSEIAWLLMTAAVLRINIREEELDQIEGVPSPVVLTLFGLLREKKILGVSLSRWAWKEACLAGGIYGRNWLPLYEAVRRKWTVDKCLVEEVTNDKFFGELLSKNVTFLDAGLLNAAHISLRSRQYREKNPDEIPNNGVGESNPPRKSNADRFSGSGGWLSVNMISSDYDN